MDDAFHVDDCKLPSATLTRDVSLFCSIQDGPRGGSRGAERYDSMAQTNQKIFHGALTFAQLYLSFPLLGGYNHLCDIWAVGITAIEMAELQPPMFDLHPMRALFLMSKKGFKPPSLKEKTRWTVRCWEFSLFDHSTVVLGKTCDFEIFYNCWVRYLGVLFTKRKHCYLLRS